MNTLSCSIMMYAHWGTPVLFGAKTAEKVCQLQNGLLVLQNVGHCICVLRDGPWRVLRLGHGRPLWQGPDD